MAQHKNRTTRRRDTLGASVLTEKDADEFERAAERWGRRVTKSKKTARETLVKLGIYTKSGKLSKHYR